MTTPHPFSKDKSHFSSIPPSKRSEYIANMLATPHAAGKPTLVDKKDYPHEDYFSYGEYSVHYYHTIIHLEPSALVFYLHGLNSHGGNSSYFGNRVADSVHNVNVYAIDFLNFGKSDGGFKGYIASFEDILSQADAFVDHISNKFANKPKKILVGHSFGGAISFKLTLKSPKKYDEVIFLVPALREVKQSQYIMKKIGKAIGYFFPKLKLTPQGEDDTKYDVSEIVKADCLNYNDRNIPGTIRVVLNAMEEIE
jgi:alpha-beta hydrolase superfamily lysophospholipase